MAVQSNPTIKPANTANVANAANANAAQSPIISRPTNPFTIVKASEVSRYIKMFMYGASGVGKTYLAATAHDCAELRDVLYLSIESGTSTLVNMGKTDMDMIEVSNWYQFVQIYDFLYAYCKLRDADAPEEQMRAFLARVGLGDREKLPVYRTLVVDTLDELQDYCMKSILGIDPQGAKLNLPYNKPGWDEYGEALDRMKTAARNLRELPMHIIVTCHNEVTKDDAQRTTIAPLLVGKFATAVQAYFDFVAYYAARQINTKDGQVLERRLFIEPGPNFAAKNRCQAAKGWISNPTMLHVLSLLKKAPQPPKVEQ